MNRGGLWLRWVAANALAEMLGLGATLGVGYLLFARLGDPPNLAAALGMILLMTASGAIEGAVVGLLQWSVLRRALPAVSRRAWVVATLAGALVAWFLGSLPSTLIGLASGPAEAAAPAQEPPAALVLTMAAAMGLVLGAILGMPQWRVLRRVVGRAWIWMPANSVAWALGMPAVFAAVDLAQQTGSAAGALPWRSAAARRAAARCSRPRRTTARRSAGLNGLARKS